MKKIYIALFLGLIFLSMLVFYKFNFQPEKPSNPLIAATPVVEGGCKTGQYKNLAELEKYIHDHCDAEPADKQKASPIEQCVWDLDLNQIEAIRGLYLIKIKCADGAVSEEIDHKLGHTAVFEIKDGPIKVIRAILGAVKDGVITDEDVRYYIEIIANGTDYSDCEKDCAEKQKKYYQDKLNIIEKISLTDSDEKDIQSRWIANIKKIIKTTR